MVIVFLDLNLIWQGKWGIFAIFEMDFLKLQFQHNLNAGKSRVILLKLVNVDLGGAKDRFFFLSNTVPNKVKIAVWPQCDGTTAYICEICIKVLTSCVTFPLVTQVT